MSVPARNLEFARSHLQAIEDGAVGAALEAFFAPGVEFVIFPNLLVPKGDRHKLIGALEGAERGRKLMAGQKYSITNEMVEGDRVALEVEWTGTLAVPFGALPGGNRSRPVLQCFWSFGKERSWGSEITIASRNGNQLGVVARRKYVSTVLGQIFMVPFHHCLQRGKKAHSGLCGQGLCWSHRFCCAFASAHC
jgi:hypothetical protein